MADIPDLFRRQPASPQEDQHRRTRANTKPARIFWPSSKAGGFHTESQALARRVSTPIIYVTALAHGKPPHSARIAPRYSSRVSGFVDRGVPRLAAVQQRRDAGEQGVECERETSRMWWRCFERWPHTTTRFEDMYAWSICLMFSVLISPAVTSMYFRKSSGSTAHH